MWVWSYVGHHSKSLWWLTFLGILTCAYTFMHLGEMSIFGRCQSCESPNTFRNRTSIHYLHQWMNWNFVFGIINHPFCVLHALHFTKALMQILITTNFDVFFFDIRICIWEMSENQTQNVHIWFHIINIFCINVLGYCCVLCNSNKSTYI